MPTKLKDLTMYRWDDTSHPDTYLHLYIHFIINTIQIHKYCKLKSYDTALNITN